jgi:hypothetical protein
MVPTCCHNCIYSCWDICEVMQSLARGRPHRPMCANQPETPAQMRPTPVGRVCRNYRPRPPKPEGDVRQIPLGNGQYAYVDAADYEWLSQYTWYSYAGGYAARVENNKIIYMHREIMKAPKGMVVDHIDGNRANNCRFNLRVCTRTENLRNNAKRRDASCRFKGVGYDEERGKYFAKCAHQGERPWLGYFDSDVEAARAYDYRAVQCYGPYARLNLPEEWPPERIQQVYAEYQAGLQSESVKGAKGVKGEKVRAQEGRRRRAGRGRVKAKRGEEDGKSHRDDGSRSGAGTHGSPRRAKSARTTATKAPKRRRRVA